MERCNVIDLNDEQRKAVESTAKKILVASGAGSGKTRTIIERINFLLARGVNPSNIYAITYTNAAAAEMRERITNKAEEVFIGTIHSLANKILLRNGIDTSAQIQKENFDWLLEKIHGTPNIHFPQIEHLLVDEFQDVCDNEYNFFMKDLKPENWFFCGDSQQSIYSFKGSNYHLFNNLTFSPDVEVYKLTYNYRCGEKIINFAEKFLARAGDVYRVKNVCKSGKKGIVEEEWQSFDLIVDTICNMDNFGDWFVLCRTNADVDTVQEVLKKADIPCDTFRKAELDRDELLSKMEENTVKVLTIHSAKGLENKNVIVLSFNIYNEEENRIAYVAATRAKDFLLWLKGSRPRWNKYGRGKRAETLGLNFTEF